MNKEYLEMIKSFKNLDLEEKKEEVLNESTKLLKLLCYCNKTIDNLDEPLPILNNYHNDNEYFDKLFTIIISLKEENAKYIKNNYKN